MTAAVDHPTPGGAHSVDTVVDAPVAAEVGNPAMIGVPTFAVGSIALAFNLLDYVGQGFVGAPIAIIALATGVGQLIAAIWAVRLNQNAVAAIFGTFAGFWTSYAALVFGLLHNWYGLTTPASVSDTVKTFLLSWLIVIVLLTVASLRLPLAFSVLFVLVDAALLFVFLAYANPGTAGAPGEGLLKIGGVLVFAFVAVGAYLFVDAMSAATGGKNLPLGNPILK